jgi:undecaprenyl pyrophosphate phosphatase UppP
MVLDAGTAIAIMIALTSSVAVMCLFWKENISLQRQIKVLLHKDTDNG